MPFAHTWVMSRAMSAKESLLYIAIASLCHLIVLISNWNLRHTLTGCGTLNPLMHASNQLDDV